MEIGYTFLVQKCAPGTIVPRVSAETAPVKRKIQKDGRLVVPTGSFLETDDLLAHIVFAIAHEGINMQILAQVLPLVKAADMQLFVEAKPTSLVSRRTGWLWELFTGRSLDFKITASTYEPLFDPKRYLTRENGERSPKWKIIFNGLGTSKWCATVEEISRAFPIHVEHMGGVKRDSPVRQ